MIIKSHNKSNNRNLKLIKPVTKILMNKKKKKNNKNYITGSFK